MLDKLEVKNKIINLAQKLYSDVTVTPKIGKQKEDIKIVCDVRQGGNLVPTYLS